MQDAAFVMRRDADVPCRSCFAFFSPRWDLIESDDAANMYRFGLSYRMRRGREISLLNPLLMETLLPAVSKPHHSLVLHPTS